jgi:hypothetical protein
MIAEITKKMDLKKLGRHEKWRPKVIQKWKNGKRNYPFAMIL